MAAIVPRSERLRAVVSLGIISELLIFFACWSLLICFLVFFENYFFFRTGGKNLDSNTTTVNDGWLSNLKFF